MTDAELKEAIRTRLEEEHPGEDHADFTDIYMMAKEIGDEVFEEHFVPVFIESIKHPAFPHSSQIARAAAFFRSGMMAGILGVALEYAKKEKEAEEDENS